MLVFLWPAAAAAAAAAPSDDSLVDAMVACNQRAVHPLPTLGAEQRAQLLAGDVVRIVDRRNDGPSAAVGMAVLQGSRDAMWIAAMDPHAKVDPGLTEFIAERPGGDQALWYGYLDLPRPLRDRQWVVLSDNNHEMSERTDNGCWEHHWVIVPDGLDRIRPLVAATEPGGITTEDLERAIFTPVNRGSWFMAPIDRDHVFVAYQASTEVAGMIPDWVVTQLAMSRLESLMRSLQTRSHTWSVAHYRQGHAPVPGGDGVPVGTLDAAP